MDRGAYLHAPVEQDRLSMMGMNRASQKDDDEFDNLYIDAQKITAHDRLGGVGSYLDREKVVPD